MGGVIKLRYALKFVNVVIFAKRTQLYRPPLNECEKAIVAAFEDPVMYRKWVTLLLIEKRDIPQVTESTVWMIKRAEQRLAAEFFTGVAMGTKYRGFKTLHELWKWLAPAVDLMYDYMNADAHYAWHVCLNTLLERDDTRRFWWLIEELLKGMARPAPSAWHQAVSYYKHTCGKKRGYSSHLKAAFKVVHVEVFIQWETDTTGKSGR
ncbi:unnamed protein product [Cylicostephanus goldi]|uniref:Proteasome activator complex subunit 4-like HEAT repeat-like domain-containing protein n=1 Tax=Cylicostephanus goldi TaxID=71465 RepID=A0A3P6SEG4_CYLGO|nr:unnamed protein product [Cylicostephanus goldi]